tara:strand:+ start:45 stop:749 length:705 start_codon:yes stop_codon:yes gene_type:complete
MGNNKFDIFFNINSTSISIGIFNSQTDENIFLETSSCTTSINDINQNFNQLENILEKKIFEVEKKTKNFLNEVYLMIETSHSNSIGLSLLKDNEDNLIRKKDILYLIQDARQQILRANKNQTVIHILITKYIIDQNEFDILPIDKKCKNFSLDIKFILIPNILLKKIEEIFKKNHIVVKKILCTSYVKSNDNINKNILQSAYDLVKGKNIQEVEIVPKKPEKEGFFERLFHIFR